MGSIWENCAILLLMRLIRYSQCLAEAEAWPTHRVTFEMLAQLCGRAWFGCSKPSMSFLWRVRVGPRDTPLPLSELQKHYCKNDEINQRADSGSVGVGSTWIACFSPLFLRSLKPKRAVFDTGSKISVRGFPTVPKNFFWRHDMKACYTVSTPLH